MIANLDAVIRLNPTLPSLYELRAAWCIAGGHYDRGIADLQTVFRLNPKDAAVKFEGWQKAAVSPESLQHGQRQVQQMLKDRPSHDPIRRQSIAALPMGGAVRGARISRRIFWIASDPVRVWDAESGPLTDGMGLPCDSARRREARFIRVRWKSTMGPTSARIAPLRSCGPTRSLNSTTMPA